MMAMTCCARDDDDDLKLPHLERNDSNELPTSIPLVVLSTMRPERYTFSKEIQLVNVITNSTPFERLLHRSEYSLSTSTVN